MLGLNIGSGDHADVGKACPGWTNIDKYSMAHWRVQPDVICDILDGIPWPDATIDRVYLGHVAEHLDYETELPFALREIRRVLKSCGQLMVVGPCYMKAVATSQPEWLLHDIRPPDEYTEPKGIEHRWLPTTEATLAAVKTVFSVAVEIPVDTVRPPRWPNACPDALWQCAVIARGSA